MSSSSWSSAPIKTTIVNGEIENQEMVLGSYGNQASFMLGGTAILTPEKRHALADELKKALG